MQVDEIIAKARAATGLHDMGDPAALEGLERLVRASNEEAGLSAVGAQRWEAQLVATLSNRLRVVDYISQHPELLERPVTKPTFVFGLPRTGTTLTINLLNADPARRCLLRWEALNSAPPAKAGALHSDPRYIAEQQKLEASIKYMPHIAAIHYEDADSPTECQYPMALSFCSQIFESNIRIPSYRDWFMKTSYLPAFRFHKQVLQVLQAENGGHWTLKNPWHPLFLNDLTTVYPDAQLVMTHRDPAEVVGSACSLIRHVRPMFSEEVDLRDIAAQFLDTFDHMIARQEAYREAHGSTSIHDLRYAELMRDPIGAMRRLYAHFDEAFTPEAEAGMTAYLAQAPQGKHGKHVYSLEEFGLSAAGVREHFKAYCGRYGI
ncbi:sulfotransferase [Acidocella sp.]|uniref:sulfotransferase family protein n=1 Tax=Acidocella sp. TaxID=50710 RepID=UPI002616232A|nr:sulfotransferase [Acidocella sp.]